jgi:hypothetical protein
MVPVRVPVAVGLNVTAMLHDAPAAKLDPQPFVIAKSLPVSAMLLMLNEAVPVFETVTF